MTLTEQRILEIQERITVLKNSRMGITETVMGTQLLEDLDFLVSAIHSYDLKVACLSDTCDDIAKLVNYKPDHNKEFSGDRLVEKIKNLVKDKESSIDHGYDNRRTD